jgi:hypothetical protein
MTEEQDVRQPDGGDETSTAEAGRAQTPQESDSQDESRPDLDARERRISERRKPAGPPLAEPDEPLGDEPEGAEATSDVEPVDPADEMDGGQ